MLFLGLVVFHTRFFKYLFHLFHEQSYQCAVNLTVGLAARTSANFETNDLSSNMNRECYTESCVDKGNPINHITSVSF